jgi:hypothetical protein
MHTVQELLERYCSSLPELTIVDCGVSFVVKWKGSFGALVHKNSNESDADVCGEANPFNPEEKRIPWPLLADWLKKNVN